MFGVISNSNGVNSNDMDNTHAINPLSNFDKIAMLITTFKRFQTPTE